MALAAGLILLAGLPAARAEETLIDALSLAYLQNPALQAERAKLRALDEQASEALAEMRPTVSLTSSAGLQLPGSPSSSTSSSTSSSSSSSTNNTRSIGTTVTQPIYKGGQIEAKLNGAQNRILAERAVLMSTEQATLLAAATAYMDVLRDRINLEIVSGYQSTLIQWLGIEKRRLTVGSNTRTDVSQAEARLAEAIADRLQAEATLASSASTYVRVIGKDPGKLVSPKVTIELPTNIDDTIDAARTNNPNVISARYLESSARNDVESLDGHLLPEVDAVGNLSRTWYGISAPVKVDGATVVLSMTLPIDNGTISAQARGARQTVSQMMLQIEDAQRQAADTAVKNWNALMAVQTQIRFREAAIQSIGDMLGGMRTEVNIGARSLTDLLNSEQEALTARQALAGAKHDQVILSFTLLSAIGRLTAQNLKLPIKYYDYNEHYQQVYGKLWGVSLAKDPK